MATEIEIDDVHEFMLEKIGGDEADPEDIVETLIYQAHQAQKQQQAPDPESDDE